MINNKKKFTLYSFLFHIVLTSLYSQSAISKTDDKLFRYPFYAGGIIGYGSTTWRGLVPSTENQNEAVNISTPINVSEGGIVGGAFAGYEITRYFAIEANYTHYPDATVFFDEQSLFSFLHDDETQFVSQTEAISVMAKVMLIIPDTNIRFFSSLGGANVHRKDVLNDYWRFSPTFGAGLNYHFTPYMMGELGANYTAGFGESNINPTESYFPFLYSVTFRLALCF